jgi:uncharacterized damage-inducible protein DinB
MTQQQSEQLSSQIRQANRRLRDRLAGITDDEYLWEPVEGCWTVRRREAPTSPSPEGRGVWVFDNAEVGVSPAPFTTIAWRLMHLVDVLGGYHACLWGDGPTEDHWLEVTPEAAVALEVWERYAGAFVDALASETDASLDRSIRIPWWPEDAPRWRIVANVATEAIHHGAEIGVLRDLYAQRAELRA